MVSFAIESAAGVFCFTTMVRCLVRDPTPSVFRPWRTACRAFDTGYALGSGIPEYTGCCRVRSGPWFWCGVRKPCCVHLGLCHGAIFPLCSARLPLVLVVNTRFWGTDWFCFSLEPSRRTWYFAKTVNRLKGEEIRGFFYGLIIRFTRSVIY